MSEATLRAKLTGDSAEFQRSMREGINAAREFGTKVGESIRETVLQVAALTIGVESVKEALEKGFEGIKGVFELSKELEHLSARTGIATKDLVQLQTEFKLSGLQADQVGSTINRMQRSIENAADKGGQAAVVFSRLGLNIAELQSLNPAQQFEAIRNSLSSIEDPARRAQIAMQLFGRQGAEMLALFKNGDIGKEASDALGGQADILARNSETFQEVASLMEIAGIKIQGFFVGLAEPIGSVILPVLKKIDSIDLTKWGQSIGGGIAEAVRVLYNSFEDNRLGDVLTASLKYAFSIGVDYLIGGAEIFGQAMKEVMSTVFSSDFGTAFKDLLVGAADAFIGTMMSWMQPFSDAITAAFNSATISLARGIGVVFKEIPGMGGMGDKLINGTYGNMLPQTAEAVKQSRIDTRQAFEISNLTGDPDSDDYRSKEANIRADKSDPGGNIGEATSDMFMTVSKGLLEAGGKGMVAPLEGLLSKLESLKFTPGTLLNSDSYKDQLSDLVKQYGSSIPGEGKQNAPDDPDNSSGRNGNDSFMGGGQIESGITRGENGGWSFFSQQHRGGVSFGDGMAGRAGRSMADPDGKNPAKHLEDMSGYLKNIDKTVSSIQLE